MAEQFPNVPDLTDDLRRLIRQVPPGRVTTCGALAEALGNPIAARWIGHFTLHHDHEANCGCHRVLRAGGQLGAYIGGDAETKARLLAAEGIAVRQGLVDLEQYAFGDLVSDRPLERLRKVQEALRKKIVVRPRRRIPKLVGGVDVAYPRAGVGRAAYALVETATGRLVWSTTVRRPVVFPYITSYLSFREIPILLDLLDEVRAAGRLADVVMVDGTGILHHRQAGIASHLGVVASLCTIGVTKKLLYGRVDMKNLSSGESRPVWAADDRLLGVALRPTAGSMRPIFVSPGHRADVSFSEHLVRHLLLGRRLPEPLYWADWFTRHERTTS